MANPTSAANGGQANVAAITAGLTIRGNVEGAAELQIGGQVEGDVQCHTLFLEEGGAVTGDITAERIRVAGTVEGTIDAADVAIEPTGRVAGTVNYTRLKISAGGVLEGTVKRRPAETAPEGGNLKLVEPAEAAKPRRVFID